MFKDYFYGNKISNYGQENGFVDYATLAKAFDAVLNNDIITATWESCGEWEQESGFVDNSEKIDEIRDKIDELEQAIEPNEEKIDELEAEIDELEAEQDETPEIFQYYIVSENGAEILKEYNEIVFYNYTLNMYVWGVTHYGTSWDYVLTDIPCEKKTA